MSASAFTPTVLTISSGTGSGSGEKNYITNPSMASATTGWNVVGDFTLTRTTAASELPREYTTGTGIKLVATSGTQSTADYMYFDFNLDDVDLNRKLKIQWSQKDVGTYAAGQLAVIITSQADRTTALHTPVTTAIPAVDGDFVTSFDSGSTAALSLVIRATTDMTTGDGIVLSDVIVGPGEIVQGAVVSEWQSYTPTLTNGGTTSQNNGRWRRVGSTMEIESFHVFTGTGSAGNFTISLPSGYTADSTRPGGLNGGGVTGSATTYDGTSLLARPVYLSTSTAFGLYTSTGTTTPLQGSTIANTWQIGIKVAVQIQEFSGSGTVSLGAGAQVEYAYNSDVTSTASVTSSGFSYGQGGVVFSSAWTGFGTDFVRRVQFQYPIQSDDLIVVEVNRPGFAANTWETVDALAPNVTIGSNFYGVSIAPVNGSSTQIDVIFQRGGAYPSGASWAANGQAWSGLNPNWYWRVRKAKASSPVGFGLAGTDGSAGLYKPGAAPGYTGSVAVPAGYIGQIISGASDGATSVASSAIAKVVTTIPLTKGSYLITCQVLLDPTGMSVTRLQAGVSTTTSITGTLGLDLVDGVNFLSGGYHTAYLNFPLLVTADATYNVNVAAVYTGTPGSTPLRAIIRATRIA